MASRATALQPKPVAPLAVAVAGTGLGMAFVAIDPSRHSLFPACPFHALTGWWCPLCGGSRAVHALGHGQVTAFLGNNALLVLLGPVVAVAWWRWWLQSRDRPTTPIPKARLLSIVGLAVVVAFTVVRNLPVGQALAP